MLCFGINYTCVTLQIDIVLFTKQKHINNFEKTNVNKHENAVKTVFKVNWFNLWLLVSYYNLMLSHAYESNMIQ
jgi:hypothetical protein